MTAPEGSTTTTARNPLTFIAPLVVAGLGLLAFIIGFLKFVSFGSSFGGGGVSASGFESASGLVALALVVGGVGAAAAFAKSVSSWLVLGVAAPVFLNQIGVAISGVSGASYGYWLLFVVSFLQVAASVLYLLADLNVIKMSPKPPAAAFGGGGYGQPGTGYGQPAQYGTPAQGQYGQPSQGYTAPASPGYGQPAGGPGYGQSGTGYGQPASQPAAPATPPSAPPAAPQQPAQQPGGGYGQPAGGGYGQPSGQPAPQQPQQGGAPSSQPWQSPGS